MTKLTLSHSDQIVATLAKLPINTFGTRSTRDVALVIASCLNKAQDWAITLCVKTIAAKSAYSPRTVQRALKKLEEIDFFNVFRRKHPENERFNFPSVYKLGHAVRSLFSQLVTTSRHGCQGKSLNSLNPLDLLQGQNYKKDPARENVNSEKKKKSPVAKVDTARLNRTPEQWEARKQEAMAHNSNALEELKRRQEEIQRQFNDPSPAAAYCNQFALGGRR
ncbi:helix-turn-helix domain-containing protein [Aeromonas veronii]|uniref:helix-turn-helix domain-containing protein n=1 Tax=Aeromonas veronii TaxID=654 RepID=UPI0011789220|nr:helix-turn-helix domain-containing protein [Aeromonas veronii]